MRLLGAALFSVLGGPVAAQTAEVPAPPPGPAIQPAPAFSHWIVTYSYPDERESAKLGKPNPESAAVNRTRSVAVTKTQDIIHEEIVNTITGKVDVWYGSNVQYTKAADASFWLQNGAGSTNGGQADSGYTPLPASGFRDLDWVASAPYVGTIPYNGRTCRVYALNFTGTARAGDATSLLKQLETVGMAAFIDAETRMPVEVRMGGVYRLYHFDSPPTSRLTLPTDLLAEIKKGQQARARLYRAAPRPY